MKVRFLKTFGIVIGFAILAAIWFHRAVQEDRAVTARTAIASSTPEVREDDIRVDAWIDDSRIREHAIVTFWIAIRNTSKTPIHDVSIIAFRKPNFSVPSSEQMCWARTAGGENVPVCTNAASRSSRRLPVSLDPGAVETLEGHLRAGDEPGQSSIAAVVGWKDASGNSRRTPISVGPITVEHEARKTLATISKAAQNFLKDLGLPLVFLFLAYRIKKLEDHREKTRKESEERTAAIRQTWMQMLPKVHANAEKYYMPLMGYADHVTNYLHSGLAPDLRICFFFYLRFLARMKEMTDAIGGFYLKTRSGENMTSDLWDALRDRADARFTRPRREEAQTVVKKIDTYAEFNHDFKKRGCVPELFDDWVKPENLESFATDAALLSMFSIVLTYEANLSYEFWYAEPERFDPDTKFDLQFANVKKSQNELAKYPHLLQALEDFAKAARARTMQSP